MIYPGKNLYSTKHTNKCKTAKKIYKTETATGGVLQKRVFLKLSQNSLATLWQEETEITLRHGCSPVNMPHISRTPFPKNTSGGMLLMRVLSSSQLQ